MTSATSRELSYINAGRIIMLGNNGIKAGAQCILGDTTPTFRNCVHVFVNVGRSFLAPSECILYIEPRIHQELSSHGDILNAMFFF